MSNEPFVIERTFNAPSSKVWQAITDRAQMKEWYFDLADFKAEPGFQFQFEGKTEEQTYVHNCVVKEVIPGRKLSYSWRYEGYEGESLVTFELFPEGDKTRLKLTHAGLERFPADNRDFSGESFAEGWNYIIGTSLKGFLEKQVVEQ